MSAITTLGKNSLIFGVGNASIFIVGYLLVPLYTHSLSPEEYGAFDLLFGIGMIVMSLASWGTSSGLERHYFYESDDEARKKLSGSALILSLAPGLMLAIILSCFSDPLSTLLLGTNRYANAFLLMLLMVVLRLAQIIPLHLLRIHLKSKLHSAIAILQSLTLLATVVVLLKIFAMGIDGIFISYIFSTALSLLVLIHLTAHSLSFRIDINQFKRLIAYSMPLLGSLVGSLLLNYGDRYVLTRFNSLADVGVYAVAYKFGMLLHPLILMPFFQGWGPRRFKVASQQLGPLEFSRVFTYLIMIELLFSLVIALFTPEAASLLIEPRYHRGLYLVPVILLAYILNGACLFCNFGFLYRDKTAQLSLVVLLCAAFNIVLNLLLVPPLGIDGAAFSTLTSFALLFIASLRLGRKLYSFPFEVRRLVCLAVSASLVWLVSLILPAVGWQLFMFKILLLGSFPLLLIVLKFPTRNELEGLRQLTKQCLSVR